STLRDLRYAVRSLAKVPTFSIAVVLTLALGIGANTAIFSIVDRILLRPLPFPEADRLMLLQETGLLNSVKFDVNPSNWMDWQGESQSFETLAVWSNRYPMTLSGQGEPERLDIETVSYEFLTALSVKPFIG